MGRTTNSWGGRTLWVFAWGALATSAPAAAPGQDVAGVGSPYELIVPSGKLRAGAANRIHVATVTPTGEVPSRPPRLTASTGSVEFDEALADGIYAYDFDLPTDATTVEFSIGVFGVRYTKRLEVYSDPVSHLQLPKRIDGVVRGGEVEFLVIGDDLPPPEALQVVVGEGRVTGIELDGPDLKVRVLPDDSPFPRHVVIGVRDASRVERPVWTGLRLRARPKLNYTTEPGASATFTVGERVYGPYDADGEGRIAGWVDQYPGENIAQGVFVDDLGNQTRTDIPLATKSTASLVAFPTGEFVNGRPPPQVYLHAVRGDGGLWNRAGPTCRTPALDLQARGLEKGDWVVPLPRLKGGSPEDMRIECNIGIHASAALRVRVAEGIPERIRLRVWPDELRTDFPEAEISVIVEDARGERIAVAGLEVSAVRGDVTMGDFTGVGARGEYLGGNAADAGLDTVQATYRAPASDSYVDSVRLAWSDIPTAGRVTLHARALDPYLRPVPDAEIEVTAGASFETAISGPDGWVSTDVIVPMKKGPMTLMASSAGRMDSALVLKGQKASEYGPGSPDLRADQVVKISAGRIAGISVELDPAKLQASPGARAFIYVRLEDRAGKAVVDEPFEVLVTEGTVLGQFKLRSDGRFYAEYEPGDIETARVVTVTAETETIHSSAKLELEPRQVRLALGAYGGALSNFGAVTAPIVGVDLDFRVRTELFGEHILVRVGGARYAFSGPLRVAGQKWQVSNAIYPLTLGALYRVDRGASGAWFGGGAVVGLHAQDSETSDGLAYSGLLVTGGPTVMGGVGQRLLGGEIFLSVRSTWLRGVGDVGGFDGNIGGLAVGAGYRVLF